MAMASTTKPVNKTSTYLTMGRCFPLGNFAAKSLTGRSGSR